MATELTSGLVIFTKMTVIIEICNIVIMIIKID